MNTSCTLIDIFVKLKALHSKLEVYCDPLSLHLVTNSQTVYCLNFVVYVMSFSSLGCKSRNSFLPLHSNDSLVDEDVFCQFIAQSTDFFSIFRWSLKLSFTDKEIVPCLNGSQHFHYDFLTPILPVSFERYTSIASNSSHSYTSPELIPTESSALSEVSPSDRIIICILWRPLSTPILVPSRILYSTSQSSSWFQYHTQSSGLWVIYPVYHTRSPVANLWILWFANRETKEFVKLVLRQHVLDRTEFLESCQLWWSSYFR